MRSLRALPTPDGFTIKIEDVPTLLHDETAPCEPNRAFATIRLPVHLVNLLRNALLRRNAAMKVGVCEINRPKLRDQLAQQLGGVEKVEITFGVRHTDWAVTDRMNYAAAQRLFSTKLLEFVTHHFGDQCRGAQRTCLRVHHP